jgi:DNA-binding NarL/FixJ family response regulator
MSAGAPRPIRVLIVEDHRLVAQGIQLLLAAEADMEVVGLAATGADGIEMSSNLKPDVILLDFRLPDASGPEVADAIRRRHPDLKTLFLSMAISPGLLLEAVRAGARGYLHKSQAAADLVDAVRRAAAGEMLIPAATLADLLQHAEAAGPQRLTPRERQLLGLLAEGLDNRAIAQRLGIRYVSVRGHLRSLLSKLDAHSRLEAVARGVELGLINR